MEVGRAHFETAKKQFTILDAPVSIFQTFGLFICIVSMPIVLSRMYRHSCPGRTSSTEWLLEELAVVAGMNQSLAITIL